MIEIENFIKLSKYAGERFDLIQAGGGNTSVKILKDKMIIKASGFYLSDIEKEKGYAFVDNNKILNFMNDAELPNYSVNDREKFSDNIINDSNLSPGIRPSIETFLHTYTRKYTLHTHPLSVNVAACRKNWDEIFNKLFDDCLCIEYKTPGIELALITKDKFIKYENKNGKNPKIIFLQNHGLIINSEDVNEVINLTESVIIKIENELSLDYRHFKITNNISKNINEFSQKTMIAYLSNDKDIIEIANSFKNILSEPPFCPDTLVYCGYGVVQLNSVEDKKTIKQYMSSHKSIPKVIVYKRMVFFIAENIKKARGIEDVFRFHLVVSLQNMNSDINYLSEKEKKYLDNWDAEKFRQEL